MDKDSIELSIDARSANELSTLALKKAESLSRQSLKSGKDLEKATSGFESLLLNEMLKSMWESVETTGLMGEDSNEAHIYRDMFNQAIADTSAKGRGMGIKSYLKGEILKTQKNKI